MTHLSFLNPRKRLKSKETTKQIDLVASVPNFRQIYVFLHWISFPFVDRFAKFLPSIHNLGL